MNHPIAHVRGVAERGWNQLLELLFPWRCAGCGRAGDSLCSDCLNQLALVRPPLCSRCGAPLTTLHAVCSACNTHPLHIARLRAAAYHEGAAREAVHALKYKGRRAVARPLAALLAQLLAQDPLPFELLTPVPLHVERERERGFNQSRLLAQELAHVVGRPLVETLTRTRATADQAGLNARERRENVRDVFEVCAPVRGARILLVDDVLTTGATMDACARALCRAGAGAVYGVAVTRARFATVST